MSPEPEVEDALEPIGMEEGLPPPRLAEYLWAPWYAKLWWIAIPVYWLPAGAPFKIAFVDGFYSTDVAIVLNIVFLPITALVLLGSGYVRAWIKRADWQPTDYEPISPVRFFPRPGAPHPSVDPYDPQSGSMWIGNSARR